MPALLFAALLAGLQPAASTVPYRLEVPVREVVLSDGTRRYAVPITVGQTTFDAGLDTGSSGLRILPNVLAEGDAKGTGRADDYSFGAGAKLDGETAKATVSVGGLKEETTVQLVHRVGCTDDKPHCAAGSIPLKDYGIQGDGLRGEGFKAILGVNMADAEVASLFSGIGARRWIIDLPRPGESAPGRIVLNPSDEETSGYVFLPVVPRFSGQRGGLHDSLFGCLVNDVAKTQVCGAVMMDSGAPGIEIVNPQDTSGWGTATSATLFWTDGQGPAKAVEHITLNQRAQASRLSVRSGGAPVSVIFAGLTPYFAFSVLYDPARGMVGLKPRPPGPEGPQGAVR